MASISLLLALALLVLLWFKTKVSKTHPPLPPGPPADPLIGHLRLMPSEDEDFFFYNLGKKYGDVIHLSILGQSFIVLNSVRTAIDLLDKRSSNYSGRPRFPLTEIIGFVHALVFMGYGKDFRLHRRIFKKYFSKDKILEHRPIQTREARVLVRNLTSKPEHRDEFLLRFATAIIIEVAYGHQIVADNDPYLKIADDICRFAVPSITPPEGSAVDIFPFLQYFPSWFPGAYYAGLARDARPFVRQLYEYPMADVREQMAKGTAKPSFLASQLEDLQLPEADHAVTIEHIQGASAILYVAGAETTSSSLSIFFLAMLLHPECQFRAQQEIDAVVGYGRLPEFSDRDSLPYLECLLQETQRWRPTVPLGVPHFSLEDDIYNGMFIPKGSIVIANARGMALDENVYDDPFAYNPARFLPKPSGRGEPYPTATFGFGRRTCPGRYLANDSLWIATATILATLSISKVTGDDGKEITPEVAFTLGVTSHPRPFQCRLQPRNEMAGSLIGQSTALETI